MTATPFFNMAAQVVAAFLIFVTGFAALFAALVVFSGVVWILWRCVDRLAPLMSNSARSRLMLESQQAPPSVPSPTAPNRALIVAIPRR